MDVSLSEQRRRMLEALRNGPVTTLKARKELDVMHPAGRIQELREEYNIVTHRVVEGGHRIARYVLLTGGNP